MFTSRVLDVYLRQLTEPPPADPDRERLLTAMAHATTHLPPAIARLVTTELDFYVAKTWLGIPPLIRTVMTELETMNNGRQQ